ncbi:MAG: PRC-barrel domain-containing protein, partial [Pelovirga sp.]
EIGKVKEFFFDEQHWAIRYLVADTVNWHTGRQVMISPGAMMAVNTEKQMIDINLTKEQIARSPSLTDDAPLPRPFENIYGGLAGRPLSWGAPEMWQDEPSGGDHDQEKRSQDTHQENAGKPCLRSSHEITGSHIRATDGELGHVEDCLIDVKTWAIRYLIIDTRHWSLGRKALISSKWIERGDWLKAQAYVNLAREAIKKAPEYVEGLLLTREYEINLHTHYQRREYWAEAMFRMVCNSDSRAPLRGKQAVTA